MASLYNNSIEGFHNICRICMASDDLQPILEFHDEFDNEIIGLSHKLKVCCNVDVNLEYNLPKHICKLCSDVVTAAYDLIVLCKQTSDTLRNSRLERRDKTNEYVEIVSENEIVSEDGEYMSEADLNDESENERESDIIVNNNKEQGGEEMYSNVECDNVTVFQGEHLVEQKYLHDPLSIDNDPLSIYCYGKYENGNGGCNTLKHESQRMIIMQENNQRDEDTCNNISKDRNTSSNIPEDRNTSNNIPEDRNTSNNIPEDRNTRNNIPEDRITSSNTPESQSNIMSHVIQRNKNMQENNQRDEETIEPDTLDISHERINQDNLNRVEKTANRTILYNVPDEYPFLNCNVVIPRLKYLDDLCLRTEIQNQTDVTAISCQSEEISNTERILKNPYEISSCFKKATANRVQMNNKINILKRLQSEHPVKQSVQTANDKQDNSMSGEVFFCQTCRRYLKTDFNRHLLMHQPNTLKHCPMCSYQTTLADAFINHVKNNHYHQVSHDYLILTSNNIPENRNTSNNIPIEGNTSINVDVDRNTSSNVPEDRNTNSNIPVNRNTRNSIPVEGNTSINVSEDRNTCHNISDIKIHKTICDNIVMCESEVTSNAEKALNNPNNTSVNQKLVRASKGICIVVKQRPQNTRTKCRSDVSHLRINQVNTASDKPPLKSYNVLNNSNGNDAIKCKRKLQNSPISYEKQTETITLDVDQTNDESNEIVDDNSVMLCENEEISNTKETLKNYNNTSVNQKLVRASKGICIVVKQRPQNTQMVLWNGKITYKGQKEIESNITLLENKSVPKDGNTSSNIPENRNTSSNIPEDRNISSNVPEDRNASNNIPEDRNTRNNMPEDRNISSNVPEDRNTCNNIFDIKIHKEICDNSFMCESEVTSNTEKALKNPNNTSVEKVVRTSKGICSVVKQRPQNTRDKCGLDVSHERINQVNTASDKYVSPSKSYNVLNNSNGNDAIKCKRKLQNSPIAHEKQTETNTIDDDQTNDESNEIVNDNSVMSCENEEISNTEKTLKNPNENHLKSSEDVVKAVRTSNGNTVYIKKRSRNTQLVLWNGKITHKGRKEIESNVTLLENKSESVPKDGNSSSNIPEDRNTSSNVLEDRNTSNNIPEDRNTSNNIPEDRNISSNVHEHRNTSSNVHEDRNTIGNVAEESEVTSNTEVALKNPNNISVKKVVRTSKGIHIVVKDRQDKCGSNVSHEKINQVNTASDKYVSPLKFYNVLNNSNGNDAIKCKRKLQNSPIAHEKQTETLDDDQTNDECIEIVDDNSVMSCENEEISNPKENFSSKDIVKTVRTSNGNIVLIKKKPRNTQMLLWNENGKITYKDQKQNELFPDIIISEEEEKTYRTPLHLNNFSIDGPDAKMLKEKYGANIFHKSSMFCDKCGYSTYVQKSFFLHLLTHEPKTTKQCPYCPYHTTCPSYLSEHIKHKHYGVPPLQCDKCPYKTIRIQCLHSHKKIHRDDNKFYYCNVCDYKTIYKGNLGLHIVTHTDERKYQCDECGTSFNSKSYVRDHIKRIHLKIKTYRCKPCGTRYLGNEGYMRHMKKKHATKNQISIKIDKNKSNITCSRKSCDTNVIHNAVDSNKSCDTNVIHNAVDSNKSKENISTKNVTLCEERINKDVSKQVVFGEENLSGVHLTNIIEDENHMEAECNADLDLCEFGNENICANSSITTCEYEETLNTEIILKDFNKNMNNTHEEVYTITQENLEEYEEIEYLNLDEVENEL